MESIGYRGLWMVWCAAKCQRVSLTEHDILTGHPIFKMDLYIQKGNISDFVLNCIASAYRLGNSSHAVRKS